jgi:RNA polymerase sigma-70 factor (ECF subfamily)
MARLGSTRTSKVVPRQGRSRSGANPREADRDIMRAFGDRDPAAAEELYRLFASRIYGLGLVLLRNQAEAEDLVQDTFLKVVRSASRYDARRGSLESWMLLNARSLAIDTLRRRTLEARIRSSDVTRPEVSTDVGPEEHAEQRDLVERARMAMHRLPPAQRSALELVHFGRRSLAEVAEIEGIPLGTVKTRLRQGVITLRRILAVDDAA